MYVGVDRASRTCRSPSPCRAGATAQRSRSSGVDASTRPRDLARRLEPRSGPHARGRRGPPGHARDGSPRRRTHSCLLARTARRSARSSPSERGAPRQTPRNQTTRERRRRRTCVRAVTTAAWRLERAAPAIRPSRRGLASRGWTAPDPRVGGTERRRRGGSRRERRGSETPSAEPRSPSARSRRSPDTRTIAGARQAGRACRPRSGCPTSRRARGRRGAARARPARATPSRTRPRPPTPRSMRRRQRMGSRRCPGARHRAGGTTTRDRAESPSADSTGARDAVTYVTPREVARAARRSRGSIRSG